MAASLVSALQKRRKNSGKNPAMTVVAKVELAQSYIAQAQRWRGDLASPRPALPLKARVTAPERLPAREGPDNNFACVQRD